MICGSDKSYSEKLTELNWSTLEFRKKYLCLVQLYKIIHWLFLYWLYHICGSDWPYRKILPNLVAVQELRVTMTLKWGLKQQGQTTLNFHFLIVTLMTGTLYRTPSCLLPPWALLKCYYLIIFVNSNIFFFLTEFGFSFYYYVLSKYFN